MDDQGHPFSIHNQACCTSSAQYNHTGASQRDKNAAHPLCPCAQVLCEALRATKAGGISGTQALPAPRVRRDAEVDHPPPQPRLLILPSHTFLCCPLVGLLSTPPLCLPLRVSLLAGASILAAFFHTLPCFLTLRSCKQYKQKGAAPAAGRCGRTRKQGAARCGAMYRSHCQLRARREL